MFSLVGFAEDVDVDVTLTNVAAIPDVHVFTAGDDIRVPSFLANIIGLAVVSESDLVIAQLQAPSLRSIINIDVLPVAINAVVWGDPPEVNMFPMNPIRLMADESIQGFVGGDSIAAEFQVMLVWLSDGAHPPVVGNIYTIRATAGITSVEAVWTSGPLTFSQTLPVGTYQIVGMRAQGAGLLAARLVLVGATHRPGVQGVVTLDSLDVALHRFGHMGVFGEFHTNTPPTVEVMGRSGTAQNFAFDLIRVG